MAVQATHAYSRPREGCILLEWHAAQPTRLPLPAAARCVLTFTLPSFTCHS